MFAGRSANMDADIGIWDTATWRGLAVLPGNRAGGFLWNAAFSHDHSLVAISFNCEVCICDIAARRLRHILVGHRDDVLSLCFSPAGKTLVTGGNMGTVKLWRVATGQERLSLPRFPHVAVQQLCFSADQGTLVAAGLRGVYWWLGADKGQAAPRGVLLQLSAKTPGKRAASWRAVFLDAAVSATV